MFFEPFDFIFGRRSQVRLLRALVPLHRPVSGREATRLAGMSSRITDALDDLVGAGLVERREAAGQYLYTFDRDHQLADAVTRLFEAERRFVADLERYLQRILEGTGGAVSAAIYGSVARGEARAGSDLDLLVLTSDLRSKEPIYDALIDASKDLERRFGVRLSPVVLSTADARRQRDAGEPFMERVIMEARRIYGSPLNEAIAG